MSRAAEERNQVFAQYSNHTEQESVLYQTPLVTLFLICYQIIVVAKNCFEHVQSLLSLTSYYGSLYLKFQFAVVDIHLFTLRLRAVQHFVV